MDDLIFIVEGEKIWKDIFDKVFGDGVIVVMKYVGLFEGFKIEDFDIVKNFVIWLEEIFWDDYFMVGFDVVM